MKATIYDKLMNDFAESVEALALEEVEGETFEENEARWQTASQAHIVQRDALENALMKHETPTITVWGGVVILQTRDVG